MTDAPTLDLDDDDPFGVGRDAINLLRNYLACPTPGRAFWLGVFCTMQEIGPRDAFVFTAYTLEHEDPALVEANRERFERLLDDIAPLGPSVPEVES